MDPTNYRGSSVLEYSFVGDKEGHGTISMGRFTHDAYFFEVQDGDIEDLTRIKIKCSRVLDSCLLVPLLVTRSEDGSAVHVGYNLDSTFEEAINDSRVPVLFYDDNAIINELWGKQIIKVMETVAGMHAKFLYHGDLSNNGSYGYRNDSLCIVMPRLIRGASDESLASEDWRALGAFFKGLVGERVSMEWDHFVNSFEDPDINALKKHPVLKNSCERHDYMRALLARFNSQWDNCHDDWMKFRDFVRDAGDICARWAIEVQRDGEDSGYKEAYYNYINSYNQDENCNLLLYVQNAMKHQEKTGRSMDDVERDIHRMFPAFATKVHSIFADFFAVTPHVKVFP